MSKEVIKVEGEYIKLQDVLKLSGLCMTGGHAKAAVQNGEVEVNGETCTMRGKKLRTGDTVSFDGKEIEVMLV
ncbi:MAG: RNA-binding S4 domain-containing protein [Ruminococcus sp.]|nr:RNA-binding S4 domain-containing protein [Ruminococcus sp.]